jgi:hypothetical protein
MQDTPCIHHTLPFDDVRACEWQTPPRNSRWHNPNHIPAISLIAACTRPPTSNRLFSMDLSDPVTIGLIAAAVTTSVLLCPNSGVSQLRADKRQGPKPYRERAKKQRGDHTKSQMAHMLETGDHLRANTRFAKFFRPVYRLPAFMYEDISLWMDQNRLPFQFQKRDYDCCGEAAYPLCA